MNVRMKLPNLLLAGLLPWIALSIRSLNPNSPSLNASQLEYRFWPAIVGADRGILEVLAPISRKADTMVASLGYGFETRPQHERWVYIFGVHIKEAWPQVAGAYLGVLPLNGRAKRVYKRIGFVHKGEAKAAARKAAAYTSMNYGQETFVAREDEPSRFLVVLVDSGAIIAATL
ncbi:hypothetical protein FOZ63_022730 [Perkinsus olseni]|uniref:Uncharacterized protein n=1 Tax=Perkinsus olseni TaxID=32597 RepID=A0A7J6UKS1_PEROL|nr:hypothetical protein FOZ63_022730 [Perkinsus olseni]